MVARVLNIPGYVLFNRQFVGVLFGLFIKKVALGCYNCRIFLNWNTGSLRQIRKKTVLWIIMQS
jgi:hypothetical protein